jgi:hypothetical protein
VGSGQVTIPNNVDCTGGIDLTTTGLTLEDELPITFGDDSNYTIKYHEDGTVHTNAGLELLGATQSTLGRVGYKLTITASDGSTNSGVARPGGAGGPIHLTAGSAGISVGGWDGSQGGDILITAGDGGDCTSWSPGMFGGTGGALHFVAGEGGDTPFVGAPQAAGYGGDLSFQAGDAGAGPAAQRRSGGHLYLNAGEGGTDGIIYLGSTTSPYTNSTSSVLVDDAVNFKIPTGAPAGTPAQGTIKYNGANERFYIYDSVSGWIYLEAGTSGTPHTHTTLDQAYEQGSTINVDSGDPVFLNAASATPYVALQLDDDLTIKYGTASVTQGYSTALSALETTGKVQFTTADNTASAFKIRNQTEGLDLFYIDTTTGDNRMYLGNIAADLTVRSQYHDVYVNPAVSNGYRLMSNTSPYGKFLQANASGGGGTVSIGEKGTAVNVSVSSEGGSWDVELTGNTAGVFYLSDATTNRDYLAIDTSTGSEEIRVGNFTDDAQYRGDTTRITAYTMWVEAYTQSAFPMM